MRECNETTSPDTMKDLLKDFALNVLLAMSDPDPKTEIKQKFLSSIIPDSWKERVYELDNKYLVETKIDEFIPHNEGVTVLEIIKREFGKNVISIMAENTAYSTKIVLLLKKPNYKEESQMGMAL